MINYKLNFIDSLKSCGSLEMLDISDNSGLERLPDWIGELKSLRTLEASYSGLTSLTEGYLRLFALFHLYMLRTNGYPIFMCRLVGWFCKPGGKGIVDFL